MKKLTTGIITALMLLPARGIHAVEARERARAASGVPAEQHEQHHAQPPRELQKTAATDACKTMMASQQQLMAEIQAMDARLADLVTRMNEARGDEKIAATASVVAELVAQRRMLNEKMGAMYTGMMSHMVDHMAAGMSSSAKEATASCPMMQQMHQQRD